MFFNGALGFFVIQDRFSKKIVVYFCSWSLILFFNESIGFFWLQAFCKDGAVGVFSLKFIGLFTSEMSFQRELCVFVTFHCVFKGLLNFLEGPN